MPLLKRIWHVLHQTVVRWTRNDGNLLATSMAYYAAFSFFPLIMVLISALGFALRLSERAQDARQQLLEIIAQNTSPELSHEVEQILAGITTRASLNTPVALITLLFGAIGIFSQLESAFDRLWHQITPHEPGFRAAIRNALWNRLKAFVALIALGVLVVVAFLANILLTAFQNWAEDWSVSSSLWSAVQLGFSIGLNAVVFTLLYKLVPRMRVQWLHAACGGLSVAVLWQLGSQLVAQFILGGNYSAYGVVGSFIAMMLWVYWASILIFLGGQLVQVLGIPKRTPRALAILDFEFAIAS